MDPILRWAKDKQPDLIRLIRRFVEYESPTDSPDHVNAFTELLAEELTPVAACRTQVLPGTTARALVASFNLQGVTNEAEGEPGILALGHSDTVWPVGTLAGMPYRESGGRLWGPGVLDMKAGIAFFIFAMRALGELQIPISREVLLLINPDEETGSRHSRAATESMARRSKAVLVLEPGTGLDGKAKTARKGVGDYHLLVRGKAAHAGVDFEKGASAIVELGRQIERIAAFSRPQFGITVNPGVISGGTRTNVVAAEARVDIDVRVTDLASAADLDRKFHSLTPVDPRCSFEISGGLNRPPMVRTNANAELFDLARKLSADLGVNLEESLSGGGSDGSLTSALGIPTLDGIGAVGEGAHAANESILTERMADRVALLARLVAALS